MTGVTPDELSVRMAKQDTPCAPGTIRYHCRDRRGMLYDHARKVGRSWLIDPEAADLFASTWTRYQTLRRRT